MPYNADSTAIEDIIKMLPPAAQAEALAAYRSKGVTRVPNVTMPASSGTTAAPIGKPTVDETEDDTQDQTGGLGGSQAAAAQGAPNPLMDFLNTAKADLAEQEQTRAQQFAAAKARIEQMYAQPSREDLLIALSRGFLSPKPYRGFAGTMHNLSEALGGFSSASKEAQLQRQQALMQLQQAYNTGTLANKKELLALGLKGATAQAAAAAKPQFGYQLGSDNMVHEVPKDVARPMNKAQYDALPFGAYYLVPNGPDAGKIVRKLPPQG